MTTLQRLIRHTLIVPAILMMPAVFDAAAGKLGFKGLLARGVK